MKGRKKVTEDNRQLFMRNRGIGTRRQIDLLAKVNGMILTNDKQRIDYVVKFMKAQYKVVDNINKVDDGN